MSVTESNFEESVRCERIIGFWQTIIGGICHLTVVDQSRDGETTTLSVYRRKQNRWQRRYQHQEQELWVKAADGRSDAEGLLFCFEVNRHSALRVTHLDFGAIKTGAAEFVLVDSVDLDPERSQKVDLPVSRGWHTQGSPLPEESLFAPSMVRGRVREPVLIANCADGQALFLGTEDPQLNALTIPRAFEPRACKGNDWVISFRRVSEPCFPRQLLERYSGSHHPIGGDLIVTDLSGIEENLSERLEIGTVTAQTLALDGKGNPWLFALYEEAVGTAVIVLRHDLSWQLSDLLSFRAEIERIDAIWDDDGWSLVLAHRAADDWELLAHRWRPD